ncbi:MAG: glycoside hydrolase family 127 protein [Anaerolineae bacterium]|nr:glycoside hydrolase family 127 protein [Anaerolineae bacterium]
MNGKYLQQHVPIRRQTVPVGHSVRFGYLETATAMLALLLGEASLLPAMEQPWEHMVQRRMYVTGGIGAVPALEGFGNDYELDPELAYAETCAALSCLFWNWQLSLITARARYSDLFEWQLYNAAAVGMGLSGKDYLYNNPLVCRSGVTRRAWYSVPCCPSNLSRTWADLGKYICSADADNLWIHQYIGSRIRVEMGEEVNIHVESDLPWIGKTSIHIKPARPREFTLHLRIPSWVAAEPASPMIKINNEPLASTGLAAARPSQPAPPTASGYDPEQSYFLPIRRVWSAGDMIELTYDMPICQRHAHAKVKGHQGKVALTRGPLVYCLESTDNPGVDIFSARLDPASLQTEHAPHLLGGISMLKGATQDGQPLTFIPYNLWANRGESQMTVWVNT